ncbi:unknown [[Mannheimia] succiniciproducens MBEL55E]|uniref:Uncharacterized protein n=1 Tax=Mannheimia succiniciproducens (strain KCTC 0769BP / MBEL55E) TaxID=221988 RepID=Q65SI8_MANSM|nr:unknown [[Mannheimia] succiniciproducens MBEL55E]
MITKQMSEVLQQNCGKNYRTLYLFFSVKYG